LKLYCSASVLYWKTQVSSSFTVSPPPQLQFFPAMLLKVQSKFSSHHVFDSHWNLFVQFWNTFFSHL
jgi:hypothetical protein